MTNRINLTPDQQAAHFFLSELRTRIATQPLPYQHGVEERALESLFEVFVYAREAMKKHPGCEVFARETTHMLNADLRPITAKWHRAMVEGRLRSRDGGDAFRADLAKVQDKVRAFSERLSQLAYDKVVVDVPTVSPLTAADLAEAMGPIPYGIPTDVRVNGGIPPATARAINGDEADSVAIRRRAMRTVQGPDDAVGVAFSGGGIRSATFCLGVTQVLAARRLLGSVDFLSTVSGGGYTGSFLTMQLSYGVKQQDLAQPHGPDPDPIRGLRLYAKYLVGGSLWSSWRMFLETVLGMLFNWCVPLWAIAVVAFVSILWKRSVPEDGVWITFVWVSAAVTAVCALAFYWAERTKTRSVALPGWVMSVAACVLVAALGVWSLDVAFGWLVPDVNGGKWTWNLLVSATGRWSFLQGDGASWLGLGFSVSLIPTALRYLPLLEKPLVRKAVVTAALAVGALFVPVLAILAFYVVFALGAVCNESSPGTPSEEWRDAIGLRWLGLGALGLHVIVALFLNINVTGPHRLYRRGLARTFVDRDKERPWIESLAELNPATLAPYLLLNATVNLPSSTAVRSRERKGDFFLFSKHWSGSPVVGYQPTSDWRMDGSAPDLSTAMAISGAAFSSNMGLGSIAPLRALLAFLNVRLGFWIRRPEACGILARVWSSVMGKHPSFSCLLREMSGLGMQEKSTWLNLSDGGHIENLGLYELLRRRCKFLVCVDGEADPGFTLNGLMTLVRHAQIDLGIEIEANVTDLRPDSKTGHSRSHYHFWRVKYPADKPGGDRPIGLLLYLKLSVTGNESALVARYRSNNPSFPHQTTLDQFFDEEQFEAYRDLGVHVAEGLFSPTLMRLPGQAPSSPIRVCDWFARLAANLLTPST